MLDAAPLSALSAYSIARAGFIVPEIAKQTRQFDAPGVPATAARVGQMTRLSDAPNKHRLNARDMTAVMITEQPPKVPNFTDLDHRIKAALREDLGGALQGCNAVREMNCSVRMPDEIRVPARDIARLELCNAVLKALWALLPNGQGNQLRTIRLSNCRSYTATEVMRQANGALGLSNEVLTRLCSAKEALSQGTAIYEHLAVESCQDEFDDAVKAVKSLERKFRDLVALRRMATDKQERCALKIKATEIHSNLQQAKKTAKHCGRRLIETRRNAELEAKMELDCAQSAWDHYRCNSDPDAEELDLTKRVLAVLTFGAGNCAEFAEVAFYLVTHGLCGELPPCTPVYQVELSASDHNLVLIGELTDNPIVVDGWTLVPTPMRLSESAFGDLIAESGQLADSLSFTIINEFRPSDSIREAFPEAVVEEYRDELVALYEAGTVKQKASIRECVGDARDGERSGVLWNQASLANAVPLRYVSEDRVAQFIPQFPLARVSELKTIPATLRAVRS